MKRIIDIIISFFALLIFLPFLLIIMLLIWLQDFHSPFYLAPRIGKNGKQFKMIKLRSMIINADKSGVDSTAANDTRITKVGCFIRKFKLDEFSQLINVLLGNMSLVGPRPNVKRDADLYTEEESRLLDVKPGITDISSIVFSDEGDILRNSEDPDLKYNQVIRPWKIRLGLLYVQKQNFFLDISLLILTAITIFSRYTALKGLQKLLKLIGAEEQLIIVAARKNPLNSYPPPGTDKVISCRTNTC